jgi:rhodanese-related sulfurtransferase
VRIDSVDRLQELLARDGQLVEVLPDEEYREEHLPGAINIPLKRLDAESGRGSISAGPSSSTAGMPFET